MNIFRYGSLSPEGVLKIDETKSKPKIRARKRKRIVRSASSSECDVSLPENCLAVGEKVCTSAAKNKLTTQNVKNILKKAVTNEHVLALVKLREEAEDSEAEIVEKQKPKFPVTRAKAKQLSRASTPTAPCNLPLTSSRATPVKTTPEVSELVSQQLPEEESDDEYHPTDDAVDLNKTPSERDAVDHVEEEATIARRTRSKLCLSETSIEPLEKSFVPPDIPDDPIIDDVWTDFITNIMNSAHDDDKFIIPTAID